MAIAPTTAEAALAGVVAAVGMAAAGVGILGRRRAGSSPMAYLTEMAGEDNDTGGGSEYDRRLSESVVSRLLTPMVGRLADRVLALTPSRYTEQVHHRLMVAGLGAKLRAEEFITIHALSVVVAVALGVGVDVVFHPAVPKAVLLFLVLAVLGFLGPSAWLKRTIRLRQATIRKQLPDVLDLLAIAVEAGSGFEGAMGVVCANFSTTMGDELTRTLKEMELGLSRRDALQNLKHRNDVAELSNLVLALLQADALGMPVGPVLRAQGNELRLRRRQWARERAAKLPVKMLFPMVLFIFPSIFVVLLGPAAESITHLLKTTLK